MTGLWGRGGGGDGMHFADTWWSVNSREASRSRFHCNVRPSPGTRSQAFRTALSRTPKEKFAAQTKYPADTSRCKAQSISCWKQCKPRASLATCQRHLLDSLRVCRMLPVAVQQNLPNQFVEGLSHILEGLTRAPAWLSLPTGAGSLLGVFPVAVRLSFLLACPKSHVQE